MRRSRVSPIRPHVCSLGPLSERFGRKWLYIAPYAVFLLFVLGTALVQILGGFLVLRFLSGWFASVTIANFGAASFV